MTATSRDGILVSIHEPLAESMERGSGDHRVVVLARHRLVRPRNAPWRVDS